MSFEYNNLAHPSPSKKIPAMVKKTSSETLSSKRPSRLASAMASLWRFRSRSSSSASTVSSQASSQADPIKIEKAADAFLRRNQRRRSSSRSTLSSVVSTSRAFGSVFNTGEEEECMMGPARVDSGIVRNVDSFIATMTACSSSTPRAATVPPHSPLVCTSPMRFQDVLRNPEVWERFRCYVIEVRKSPEVVMFLESVRGYVRVEDPVHRAKFAETIVSTFIRPGAILELNLADSVRTQIMQTTQWSPASFTGAYEETCSLTSSNFLAEFTRYEARQKNLLEHRSASRLGSEDGGEEEEKDDDDDDDDERMLSRSSSVY